MRVLITGGGGQLGRDLRAALAGHTVLPLSHAALDATDAEAVRDALEAFEPDLVVHAAALTDTTRCERDRTFAHAVNAIGSRNVAEACRHVDAAIAYVSTNEVFDGAKKAPYLETDPPHPINAYGLSKLEGEEAVRDTLADHYIVRTAWLYGHGGNHFVSKVLRAAEAGPVTGVTDEIATPTWTRDLAAALAGLIETGAFGVYHLTNAGEASRYEWAQEALRLAGRSDVHPNAVTTAEFRASLPPDTVAPAKPPYSVLANVAAAALGIELRPWREALAEYFATA
jgi:dTDP-4-dehydrorhamnose reductase